MEISTLYFLIPSGTLIIYCIISVLIGVCWATMTDQLKKSRAYTNRAQDHVNFVQEYEGEMKSDEFSDFQRILQRKQQLEKIYIMIKIMLFVLYCIIVLFTVFTYSDTLYEYYLKIHSNKDPYGSAINYAWYMLKENFLWTVFGVFFTNILFWSILIKRKKKKKDDMLLNSFEE